jgi:hypothetical protein
MGIALLCGYRLQIEIGKERKMIWGFPKCWGLTPVAVIALSAFAAAPVCAA